MNLNTIQELFNNGVAFSAIIGASVLAITQLVKKYVPKLPKNYIPLIAVVFGVLIAFFTKSEVDTATRVIGGIIAGFTATGMFETVFNPRNGLSNNKANQKAL